MKCKKCGFIFNGEKDYCPYCGTKLSDGETDFLHTSVTISPNVSLRGISVISIILVNLFIVSVFIDWALGFTLKLTLFSFLVNVGILTGLFILYKKRTTLTLYIAIDLFCLFLLFILTFLGRFGSADLRGFSLGVLFPAYLILSSLSMVIVFLFAKKRRFSPVGLTIYSTFRMFVGMVLFILASISFKTGGDRLAIFDFSNLITASSSETALAVSRMLCAVSFGFAALILLNILIFLFYRIAGNIRKFYGTK